MRRSSALLASAALAASVLLVPGTAHADGDATDIDLELAFDRLAADRVAKLTLNATSASGVTSVRAKMRYESATAEPYATVELVRTEGTDNDGVWQAEFRPDIETRPGLTVVEVVVTTADGLTTTRRAGLRDCYVTTIADLTGTPGVIDIEDSEVTLRGRVEVQKDHGSAPQPVPGATVDGPGTMETTTGEDGSFVLNYSGSTWSSATLFAQGKLCYAYARVPLTVNKQSTEISARMTPASTVAPYERMVVQGKVVRNGSAGPAPVHGVEVRVNLPSELTDLGPLSAKTYADGTFRTSFTAAREAGVSGPVAVSVSDTGFLTGSQVSLGTLNIRNISEISGYNAFPEPLAYGDPIIAHGLLSIDPDFTNSTNLPVVLEFSPDGETWRTVQSQTLDRQGNFYFSGASPAKRDGYWRARYPGSPLNTPAVSRADYVDVKYRTQMYYFNASPEPVRKGEYITVKGLLYRFMDESKPGPGAKIHIYFRPKGSSDWTKKAIVKTARNGWFRKKFKASRDGTWLARYWGSRTYLGSNHPADYVNVR